MESNKSKAIARVPRPSLTLYIIILPMHIH